LGNRTLPNTFVKLPVREGENVLVWFGILERPDAPGIKLEQLASIGTVREQRMSVLDLEPTVRSALGNGPNTLFSRGRDAQGRP
jgi:hypothetical protein